MVLRGIYGTKRDEVRRRIVLGGMFKPKRLEVRKG